MKYKWNAYEIFSTVIALFAILVAIYFGFRNSALKKEISNTNCSGGDINIKAGNGSPYGSGGSVKIGPGIYKAGNGGTINQ
ncbi:MAG: hypothetical protein WCW02_01650 [Candidatus Buchananbacteria bacterium]